MINAQWKLVDEVRSTIKKSRTVPSGFFISLTRRLEQVLSNPSAEQLGQLRDGLHGVLNDAVAMAPPPVVQAVGESTLDDPIAASYILGQLSFAHQLVHSIREKASSKVLHELINNAKFKPYILALTTGNLSGKDLADLCGRAPETVSRNLAELREHGITDFRREGTSLVNFLTPVGRILSECLPKEPKIKVGANLSEAKEKIKMKTANEFIGMPMLSKKA
ncbi:helix-turn-helix domain-containing protein [Massilia sp. GER05]|uniref:helix-turn-helix domain-containing protein n=1 Tax=Massilia sp. GER05 TaxID=3394605 RepID=UPI003F83E40A